MKAIQYRSYGDYSENRLVDLPQPVLRDGEVLVAMRTVGINPLDNTFRSGHFYGATPENLPRIGGQTGAGAVVASKNDAFNVGNRVFVEMTHRTQYDDLSDAELVRVLQNEKEAVLCGL